MRQTRMFMGERAVLLGLGGMCELLLSDALY